MAMKTLDPTPTAPTDENISKQAYQIWESEGCPDGRDQEFWFQAEILLTPAIGSTTKKSPA